MKNMVHLVEVFIFLLKLNIFFPASIYQSGILRRMKEKENERDLAERELSSLNLSHIDERERNLVCTQCVFLLQ